MPRGSRAVAPTFRGASAFSSVFCTTVSSLPLTQPCSNLSYQHLSYQRLPCLLAPVFPTRKPILPTPVLPTSILPTNTCLTNTCPTYQHLSYQHCCISVTHLMLPHPTKGTTISLLQCCSSSGSPCASAISHEARV